MSDEYLHSDWDEDDDEEQTVVVSNPLSSRVGEAAVKRASSGASSRAASGPTPDEEPPSTLYERLSLSGALDVTDRDLPDAEVPRVPAAQARRVSNYRDMPPAADLQGIAQILEGDYGYVDDADVVAAEPASPRRDSVEELRYSDLDLVPEPEAVAPPVAALPPPAPLPRPMPSIMLGSDASTRNDATERFATRPSTHPLANTLSPPISELRAGGEGSQRSSWWMAIAAVVLLGAGIGIGTWWNAGQGSAIVAGAQPSLGGAEPESGPVHAASQSAAVPQPDLGLAASTLQGDPTHADDANAAPDEVKAAVTPEPELDPAAEARRAARREAREAKAALEAAAAAGASEQEPSSASATEQPIAGSGTKPKPAAALPAQPSREQVIAVMDGTLPKLRACTGDKHGTAHVTLTVRGAGRVSYALVGGAFAGSSEGSCIARVVKEAQFPAFSEPSIRVTYPFQL